MAVANLEFIQGAGFQVGDEQFPYAGGAAGAHRVDTPVPAIEIPHHADPFRIRRPYREKDPAHLIHYPGVGAQEPVGMPVLALAEQVQVEIRKLRGEIIRVVGDVFVMTLVPPDESVSLGYLAPGAPPFEDVRFRDALHGQFPFGDGHLDAIGKMRPHHGLFAIRVSPQNGEGIVVPGLHDLAQVAVDVRSAHGHILIS